MIDEELYTIKEFARSCVLRGICSKVEAMEYAERHRLAFLTESDFEAVYRETETHGRNMTPESVLNAGRAKQWKGRW